MMCSPAPFSTLLATVRGLDPSGDSHGPGGDSPRMELGRTENGKAAHLRLQLIVHLDDIGQL